MRNKHLLFLSTHTMQKKKKKKKKNSYNEQISQSCELVLATVCILCNHSLIHILFHQENSSLLWVVNFCLGSTHFCSPAQFYQKLHTSAQHQDNFLQACIQVTVSAFWIDSSQLLQDMCSCGLNTAADLMRHGRGQQGEPPWYVGIIKVLWERTERNRCKLQTHSRAGQHGKARRDKLEGEMARHYPQGHRRVENYTPLHASSARSHNM